MSDEKTYYESQQAILNRMLSKDELSTQAGSVNYNIHSPFAIELENVKAQMDEIIKRNNIISAYENGYEEEVVRYCRQDGIERKKAKNAHGIETFFGSEGTEIPAGYKFGDKANGLVYETLVDATIDNTGSVDVLATSVEQGSKYNMKVGKLEYIPVKLVGITGCTNKTDFKDGRDLESIDDLYYRDQLKANDNPNGVNEKQFEAWALEVDGVGYAKANGCADENYNYKRGHVCLAIANADHRAADQELCDRVKNYIAPDEYGTGKTMMCILHVISATEFPIDVSFNLSVKSAYTKEQVKENIKNILNNYIKNIKDKKLSYTKIGNEIYKAEGVDEYDNLLINNSTANITVNFSGIFVLGEVTIND